MGPRTLPFPCVIEEYHQGRIGVVYSELGKGTDIRITLKRYFD